jgi:hypothetical protein
MRLAMVHVQVDGPCGDRREREDYSDTDWHSKHKRVGKLSRLLHPMGQPLRTKADIAGPRQLVVAGCARMHDNSPL